MCLHVWTLSDDEGNLVDDRSHELSYDPFAMSFQFLGDLKEFTRIIAYKNDRESLTHLQE